MNNKERTALTEKILSKYKLYTLQGSRIKRILKDPLHTLPYFLMQSLGYIHPYKVSYKTLWGDKMSFYLPEGGMIYHYGFWEANLTNFLVKFLKEGDIFFDVGAHVGYYTILASSLVGETGRVYSFEPTPRTFKSLEENCRKKNNVSLFNNAVLNKETEITFFDYGPKYSAFNTFQKRTAQEISFRDKAEQIKVKTIILDKLCENQSITPTLIKIDAEGAEHLILEAMTTILQTKYPIVSIEVGGGDEWKDNCQKSIEILTKQNYAGYELSLHGYLKKHIPQKTYIYENLIFIHPSKMERIKKLIVDETTL